MKKRLSSIIFAISITLCTIVVISCGQTGSPSNSTAGTTSSSGSASFAPSGASAGFASGYFSSSANMVPVVVRKTIGKKGKVSTTQKITLLNLTGQNITGFRIKHSLEHQYGENMLEAGDIFMLDESRDVYYDMAAALDAQAALTPEQKSQNLYVTYNIQIVLADGTTCILHDFPFNDLKKGMILFQNGTCFLEYENILTGEDVVTRQHEVDANVADQATALAEQQALWEQQQQWAAQQQWEQQQQQQYVAPAQNNDAGCVGDPTLVW